MKKKTRVNYPEDFKVQAVTLAQQIGPTKAARQLGISGGSIATWRRSHSKSITTSNLSIEEENRRLKAEIAEQKKVIHILKSAAAFFSKDHLK
jgi:transposase